MDNSSNDVVNLAEAEKQIPGGKEMVKELAEMLLVECPKLLDQIRSSIESGNASDVKIGAHTLKGSADVFLAKRVVEAAKKLETMAANDNLDGSQEALAELEKEAERMMQAIKPLTD